MTRNILLDDANDEASPPNGERIARRLEDWRVRINRLFDEIDGWLAPLKGVSVKRRSLRPRAEALTRKSGLKQPKLEVLEIRIGERSAFLRPVGLWVIGANGRIDLTLDGRLFVIFDAAEPLQSPRWMITEPAAEADAAPLTKERLVQALDLGDEPIR